MKFAIVSENGKACRIEAVVGDAQDGLYNLAGHSSRFLYAAEPASLEEVLRKLGPRRCEIFYPEGSIEIAENGARSKYSKDRIWDAEIVSPEPRPVRSEAWGQKPTRITIGSKKGRTK